MKVLCSGMQWKYLNEECHYTTYHKKFMKWADHGIFEQMFYYLTSIERFQRNLGTDFFIDSCIIANKRGHKTEKIGYSPKHRSKKGTKITLIVDQTGRPISACFAPANEHDIQFVIPSLKRLKVPLNRIKNLAGDKGYISSDIKRKLRSHGITYTYYPRKNMNQLSARATPGTSGGGAGAS